MLQSWKMDVAAIVQKNHQPRTASSCWQLTTRSFKESTGLFGCVFVLMLLLAFASGDPSISLKGKNNQDEPFLLHFEAFANF
jgi:hypothetical protein